MPGSSGFSTRRVGYAQGWLVGIADDDTAGLVPFEVAASPGSGRRTWSGPRDDEVRDSFDLAVWAVELALLRWGATSRQVDLHLNLPLHGVTGSGPSCRLSFANGLLQARWSARGLPASSTVLIGDLTLSGDVLPVGHLAAKVQAARTAGIACVVGPSGSAEPGVRELATLDELVGWVA